MRRRKSSLVFRWRAFAALFCAAVLAFNIFALGHQRGVIATKHVQTAMMAAVTGKPCPPTSQGRNICPLSTFVPSPLAQGTAVIRLPGEARIERFAVESDIALASRISDAPFRPPRAA